jgi:YfiH family protein
VLSSVEATGSGVGRARARPRSVMPELFVRSALLDVPHGFSLREGGVSLGLLSSLNFSEAVGDSAANVQENVRRLGAAAGYLPGGLVTLRQVHGSRVVRAGAGARVEADGIWTDEATGTWVGVTAADCVPVLLSTADGRLVAAVHSGWRGTELRVAARAVQALVQQGARASSLRAAVGPCIQACCYEVSAELASRFGGHFGAEVVRDGGVRPHLDLSRAVRGTLLAAGLLPENVDTFEACTMCEALRFFSHRREGGVTGRHLAFVAPLPLS